MSVSSLHLPIAIATRPQFGSPPCTAVFTSGELTIALATRLACASSRAESTCTSISEWAPSPSRAICLVRSSATSYRAASNASSSTGPAAPDAMITDESLVDVSVSTLTQLNVRSTTRRNAASRSADVSSASVNSSEMCVAMSGSIIPTPFAIPTTRAVLPATVASASLGTVSVVIIPRAGRSASSDVSSLGQHRRSRRGSVRSGNGDR